MVAESDRPSIPARRLADRLRELREREFRPLTQKQLAQALGGAETLSIATVSLWEKPGSERLPPLQRLAAYARLFCTNRSFGAEGARLLRDDELTDAEREREAELYDELLAFRDLAQSTNTAMTSPEQPAIEDHGSLWRFPDTSAISIVCSDAPQATRPSYANPDHLNYSRYARYADLDALIEVFGQVRVDNRESIIRILPPESLEHDFALNHIVLIGGAAVAAAYFAQDIPLPKPEPTPDGKTHVFTCTVGEETREFKSLRRDDGTLVRDVGLIARGPHPITEGRTVVVLSGITSRGVYGAALCFIDSHVKKANEQYLKDRFGPADSFCILMHVPVRNNVALPPNLARDDVRLYEWSADTGAHW